MASPYKELMRLHVAGNRLDFQSISQIDVVGQKFLLTVLDEAHDIYHEGVDHAFLKDLKSERRILLSNLSQSSSLHLSFPDMPMVKLTEVVRNTKRIVAGAAAFFADALEREGVTSLGADGPPVKTFIFVAKDDEDVMNAYIRHTLDAIRHLLRTYIGLRFHQRLALIVPDSKFVQNFKPRLESALEDQPFQVPASLWVLPRILITSPSGFCCQLIKKSSREIWLIQLSWIRWSIAKAWSIWWCFALG